MAAASKGGVVYVVNKTSELQDRTLVWYSRKDSSTEPAWGSSRFLVDEPHYSCVEWPGVTRKKVFYHALSEYDKWLYEIRGGEMPKKRIFSSDHGPALNMDTQIIYQTQRSVIRGIRADIMDAVDLSFAPVDHDLTMEQHYSKLSNLYFHENLFQGFRMENGKVIASGELIGLRASSNKQSAYMEMMMRLFAGGKPREEPSLTSHYRQMRKAYEKEEKNKTK